MVYKAFPMGNPSIEFTKQDFIQPCVSELQKFYKNI